MLVATDLWFPLIIIHQDNQKAELLVGEAITEAADKVKESDYDTSSGAPRHLPLKGKARIIRYW